MGGGLPRPCRDSPARPPAQLRSRRGRLVDDDRDALARARGGRAAGSGPGPGQSAQAASERRDRDGADGAAIEDAGEVVEAGGDVLDAAAVAPVALGREVDDEAREPGAGVEDEAAPGPDARARAGVPVGLEVGREAMLELEGEALAHDADAVDGIDEGLAAGGEEVALDETDHGAAPVGGRSKKDRSRPAHGRRAAVARVRKVAERRVAAWPAVSARSMPCMNAERARPRGRGRSGGGAARPRRPAARRGRRGARSAGGSASASRRRATGTRRPARNPHGRRACRSPGRGGTR